MKVKPVVLDEIPAMEVPYKYVLVTRRLTSSSKPYYGVEAKFTDLELAKKVQESVGYLGYQLMEIVE